MNEAIETLQKRVKEIDKRILALSSANISGMTREYQSKFEEIQEDEKHKKQDLLNGIKLLTDAFK